MKAFSEFEIQIINPSKNGNKGISRFLIVDGSNIRSVF